MANILDELSGLVTPSLLNQVTSFTGESDSAVSKGLSALLPSLMGGLVDKAETGGSGFTQIFDMLKGSNSQGMLDNLPSLMKGESVAGVPSDVTSGFMSMLFGGKSNSIVDQVSSFAGLKGSSSNSLMKMAVPLVIGFLSKKVTGGNMNASGLISMLLGQKSNIMSAIPSGFGSLLGFSGLKDAVSGAASTVTNTASAAAGTVGGAARATANTARNATAATVETGKKAASGGLGFLKWLLPLLLLALLGIFLWRSCSGSVADMADNAATTMVDGATDAANAAGDAATAGANAVGDAASAGANAVGDAANAAGDAAAGVINRVKASLPGGVEIEANEGGIESQLIDFVKSNKAIDKTTWFNFDALTFQTASAKLDMEKSKPQLENMVKILTAYPKVNLKIGGYTDSDGDDAMNLKLSQNRANAVLAYLMGKGIGKDRLAAEGFGEKFPVCAANDTPECKAKNRRIAVRVTAK